MLLSTRRVLGTGALTAAMLCSGTAIGTAEPDAPVPPPCSAAELARVISGVTFETSNYLTMHPAVNDFFTGLKGQRKDAVGPQVEAYYAANPQVQADLQAIRQPSKDFRDRCGLPPTP